MIWVKDPQMYDLTYNGEGNKYMGSPNEGFFLLCWWFHNVSAVIRVHKTLKGLEVERTGSCFSMPEEEAIFLELKEKKRL